METVGAYEAKTHLPKLLDRVAKGEQITITRHGMPVAILAPVTKDKHADVVGVISEDGIVKHLADLGEAELKKAKLADTMDPVPPIVDYDTPANVLVPLIRYSKCILVSKKSKIVGIITASDTLKMME